jgi:hypothetical protein
MPTANAISVNLIIGPPPPVFGVTGGASEKRVGDRAIAKAAAVLKILAQERFAACFERGREDQGVVEGKGMVARQSYGAAVRGGTDRDDVAKPIAYDADRCFDLGPGAPALLVRDMRELVGAWALMTPCARTSRARPRFSTSRKA